MHLSVGTAVVLVDLSLHIPSHLFTLELSASSAFVALKARHVHVQGIALLEGVRTAGRLPRLGMPIPASPWPFGPVPRCIPRRAKIWT